jgi:predicted RNA-binding protein (virulence factor B family)
MKHLKRIFEEKSMIDTNNLGDILQEITDLGYLSLVESSWWSSNDKGNDIKICIYGIKEYDKKFNCEVDYIYPDDIMEVMERLIDYLGSEGYSLGVNDKKEIESIKERPTTKTKDELKISISKYNALTMRWDDKISGYKVCYSISLQFRN